MQQQLWYPHAHQIQDLPGCRMWGLHDQQNQGNQYQQNNMDIVKEGSMCVQSQTLWRKRSWDRKYMVLTNDCLQYIEHNNTTNTEHTPPSQQHTVLYIHGDVSLTIDEERRGSNVHHHVRVRSQKQNKTFNMYCLNQEERDDWMTKILMVLATKHTEDMKFNIDEQQPTLSWIYSKWRRGSKNSTSRSSSIKSNSSRSSYSSKSSRNLSDSQHVCVVSCFLSEQIFTEEKENIHRSRISSMATKRSFSNNRLQIKSPASTPKESKLFRRHSLNS